MASVSRLDTAPSYSPPSLSQEQTDSELQEVKDLLNCYDQNFFSLEDCLAVAEGIIPSLLTLSATDVFQAREGLCLLLKLNVGTFQQRLIDKIKPLFFGNFSISALDASHYQHLAQLEKIMGEIIERHIRSDQSPATLIWFLSLYQDILEHLWLSPYLHANTRALLVIKDQYTPEITERALGWSKLMEKNATNNQTVAKALQSTVEILAMLKNPLAQKSLYTIQSHLKDFQPPYNLRAVFDAVVRVYLDERQYLKVISHCIQFLRVLRASHRTDLKSELWIILFTNNLGMAYIYLGEHDEAMACHQECLRLARKNRVDGLEANAIGNIANVYYEQGQYNEAIACYHEQLEIAGRIADENLQKRAYIGLGSAHLSKREFQEAIDYYSLGQQLAHKLGDRAAEGEVYSHLRDAYAFRMQLDEAKKCSEASLQIAFEEGISYLEKRAYMSLGSIERSLGNYQRATDYHEAFKNSPVLYKREQADSLNGMALNCHAVGDYQRALKLHSACLEIAEELGDLHLIEATYGNMAQELIFLKKLPDAIDYLNKQLQLSIITQDRESEAAVHNAMGSVYYLQKKYVESINSHNKALQTCLEIGYLAGQMNAYCNLGIAHEEQKDYLAALDFFEKHLSIAFQLNDRSQIANALSGLGTIYRHLKDYVQAEEKLKKSLAHYSLIKKEIKSSEWQITFFEQQSNPYISLELALVEQSKYEEALQVSESRRAPALNALLAKNLSLGHEADMILSVEEMQALALKHRTTFIVYSLVLRHADEAKMVAWAISANSVNMVNLDEAATPTEIQNMTNLLEEFPFYRSLMGTRSSTFTERALSAQLRKQTLRGDSVDEEEKQFVREELKRTLSQLYTNLIAPLEELLPQNSHETVTVIPNEFLSQMPFGLLIDPEGRHLIERYPVTMLPSLKTLYLMDKKQTKSYSKEVFVLGNPDTGDPKDHLPFAVKEAQELGQLFQLQPGEIFSGKQATPQAAKVAMENTRLIFMSCHGLANKMNNNLGEDSIDQVSVFEGCLKLGIDTKHPLGFLNSKEISELNLTPTKFVCLSACFSGTGSIWREGSIGLVSSFMAAGATSVLAAHWPVRDSDITVHMVKKIAELTTSKGSTLTRPQALQQVMVEMIEEHPDHIEEWGVFFLTGI